MTESKCVMIYSEIANGKLSSINAELLNHGRKLADDLNQDLSAVLVGCKISDAAKEVALFGPDSIFVIDDKELEDYRTDAYLSVMEKAAAQLNPQIILMGQTSVGRDLAPRLAFRLGTVATLDCVALSIDPESRLLLQTKPVYGGNALATFTCKSFPQIATVRPKMASPLEPDTSRTAEITPIEVDIDPLTIRTKVLEKVAFEGIRLEDVDVIVSGGRGLGGPEGFKQLEQLAKILKGAVGATRPPCDNGWMPSESQIGLTGKIVAPNLYIAVALSGASHHISGCSNSKIIVAINNDPDANIFREAHFGVVGDWEIVLPAFTGKVMELLSEQN